MAVTAPMDRELLAASSCAPGKQNSLARTLVAPTASALIDTLDTLAPR